jgi:hypothetical protein
LTHLGPEHLDLGDDDLCGGAVKRAAVLDPPIGQFSGMLT